MIQALLLVCAAQAGVPSNPFAQLDAHTVGRIMASRPLLALVGKTGLHPHLELGPAVAVSPLTATDFKLGSRLLPDQILASAGSDKNAAKQAANTLNAAIDGFEKTQRKGNVAAAVAWLLFNAMDPYTHVIAHLSDDQGDAVITAVNDELAASPAFRKLNDLGKQQLYEACLASAAAVLNLQKAKDVAQAKELGRTVLEAFATR